MQVGFYGFLRFQVGFYGSGLILMVFQGYWLVSFHGFRGVFGFFLFFLNYDSRLIFHDPGDFSDFFTVPCLFFMNPGRFLWIFIVSGPFFLIPGWLSWLFMGSFMFVFHDSKIQDHYSSPASARDDGGGARTSWLQVSLQH